MREVGTDVLLLQEVQRGQARRIAKALGARSAHWGLKHWPVRVWAEGMAVLGLTVPVAVRSYPVTRRWEFWSWRRRLIQIGHIDGVTLVNVHLTPHGPTSEADRAREVGWLLDHVDRAATVVAAGDFNAQPRDVLFDRLTAVGLRDAWAATYPDDLTGGLTNWSGRRNRPPMRRLDYLWVSSGVDVDDVLVPAFGADSFDRYPALSDHLPVTAELRFSPG